MFEFTNLKKSFILRVCTVTAVGILMYIMYIIKRLFRDFY